MFIFVNTCLNILFLVNFISLHSPLLFMRVGVLFSGGKDSCLALKKVMEKEEAVCLITVISENKESFMFHTPNIHLTEMQAEAIGLPLVSIESKGLKEEELGDLKEVIAMAKEVFGIEGVATGTIESVYQATRIQKICDELGLWCFNPLWQKNQVEILKEVVKEGFDAVITGVFAEPFDSKWLGRKIDERVAEELEKMGEEYFINPSGEGGEIETTVLDAPFFKKRIKIEKSEKEETKDSGVLNIEKAVLVKK